MMKFISIWMREAAINIAIKHYFNYLVCFFLSQLQIYNTSYHILKVVTIASIIIIKDIVWVDHILAFNIGNNFHWGPCFLVVPALSEVVFQILPAHAPRQVAHTRQCFSRLLESVCS